MKMKLMNKDLVKSIISIETFDLKESHLIGT